MEHNATVTTFSAWLTSLDAPKPIAKPLPFVSRTWSLQNDAVVMTLATFALTILLELISLDAVRSIWCTRPGPAIYLQGIMMNIVNNGLIGPIAYDVVASARWMSPPLSAMGRVAMVGGILLGHSIGYYLAHRWMHTRKMYWAHRFHHKFNQFVSPTTANAVSLAEYTIAYMLPFIAGAWLLRPDRVSMFVGVGIISLNNLLIHTPRLEHLSMSLVPWWAVSTADHLDHHKRLTTHWAAPTISIDKLLACVVGHPDSYGKKFVMTRTRARGRPSSESFSFGE
jgi:sterol desaturase/sphingolipid hydroxylase (fatty acid hydroxylase superfamily)